MLVFKFSERIQEDRTFWREWLQAFPKFNQPLISSWMQFWLVTAVPKYFKICYIKKDLLAISKLDFLLYFGEKT
jgi:hypothetical protein